MGRDRKSKHKLSRREGKDLFGTGGPGLERRLNQPPGMHGRKPTRKESVYVEHLREKQKVKRMYGLREDQVKRFMGLALQTREQTGPPIREARLDPRQRQAHEHTFVYSQTRGGNRDQGIRASDPGCAGTR